MLVTGTGPDIKTVVGIFSGDELDEIPSDGSFTETNMIIVWIA